MSRSGKGALLSLLAVVLAFNYVDRYALAIVLQSIKTDLGLSDTQLGLMTGFAFAIFYATMGLPIARWADRGDRVTIITLALTVSGAAVALCGAVQSFLQLILVRMVVSIGEAGCLPPSLSLISDYFDRQARPRAMALYLLGAPLSLIIGAVAAGWLNQFLGWRLTFVLLGLPSLALAIAVKWVLKEPRRNGPEGRVATPSGPGRQASPLRVLADLWRLKTYRNLLLCFSVWGFFSYGVMQWEPAFFVRSFGLGSGELGTWFALVAGVSGLIGGWLGGEIASRFFAEREGLQLVMLAWSYVIASLLGVFTHLAPNAPVAFIAMGVASLIGGAGNGPLFASIQTVVPPGVRGTAVAVMYFLCNLIGLGLGPLSVGLISDALRPIAGAESLRYALLLFSPGTLWCAWCLWRASRTVADDVAATQGGQAEFPEAPFAMARA